MLLLNCIFLSYQQLDIKDGIQFVYVIYCYFLFVPAQFSGQHITQSYLIQVNLVLITYQLKKKSFTRMKKIINVNLSRTSLIPQQPRQLQQERMKADQLMSKKQQIEATLMQLKHNDRQCMNLINKVTLNPQYQAQRQVVKSKADSLSNTFDKYQSQKQAKFQNDISKIQIEEDLQQQKMNLAIQNSEAKTLELFQQFLINKLSFYQNEYESVKQKLQVMNQQLHKRERSSSQLQGKIDSLIEEINAQFPSQISQQEVNSIKKLNFNQFSLSCHEEIKYKRQKMETLKFSILELKNRYFKIELELRGKEQVEEELEKNEVINRSLNQQVNEISRYNDHLEANMRQEVERVVNQKVDSINYDSYSHVSKYLQASDYLLQKFGQILQKEELEGIINQIQNLKQSAENKYQQRP